MSKEHLLSFEDAMEELEALVDTLEQDDMPLDESLMRFGNGLITNLAARGIETQSLWLNTSKPRCFVNNINKLSCHDE